MTSYRVLQETYNACYRSCPRCGCSTRGPLDCDGPRVDCANPLCDWSINLLSGIVLSKKELALERVADPDPEC